MAFNGRVGSNPTRGTTSDAGSPRPYGTSNVDRDITATSREAARIRERLKRLQDDLKRARATQRVLTEQVRHLADVTDDAETRKLVSQTPLADRAWQEARIDRDRHARLLEETRMQADDLEAERDRLLDRLFDLEGTT